jgi:predicted anti-sigma-YlaC factor YlaD
MTCTEARRAMFEALDGGPPPEPHLGACEPCRALFESLRRVDELLRAEPVLEPPPGLARRITRAVVAPRGSAARDLLKIAAAILVILGLTAAGFSTLEDQWGKQKRWGAVVRSGFESAVTLTQDGLQKVREIP